MPDPLDKTILEHIASLGYRIHIEARNTAAIHEETGQVYRVTFDHGDRYKAACELAKLVRIHLMDG